MRDEDIPGTPGVRSIGGEPLSEAASDDDDGSSSGGGGGGGSSNADGVTAGEFSGDEVREAVQTDQTLDEVNDPDEVAAGVDDDGGDSGGGSGASPFPGRDAVTEATERRPNDGAQPQGSAGDDSTEQTQQPQSDQSPAAEVETDPPPGRTLTGDEVRTLVEAQQRDLSEEQFSRLKQRALTNESVPEGTAAFRVEQRTVDELDALDSSDEVDVVRTDDGLEPEPSAEGREALAQEATGGNETLSRDDVEVTDNFGTELTESGREELAGAIAAQRGVSEEIVSVSADGDVSFSEDAVRSAPAPAEQRNGPADTDLVAPLQDGSASSTPSNSSTARTQSTRSPRLNSPPEGTEDVLEEATTGGLLSEDTEEEIGDLGQRFSDANQFVVGSIAAGASAATLGTVDDDSAPVEALEGALSVPGQAANVFSLASAGETAAEVTEEVLVDTANPTTENIIEEEGVAATLGAAGTAADVAASQLGQQIQNNPARLAGQVAGGVVTGAAAGRVAGRVGRGARDRIRTAGAERIPLEDVANQDVIDFVESGGERGERFPGARDPDQFQTDPAEAVRQQADDFTPEQIREQFEDAGIEQGTDVKKALGVEPEGPDGDRGFESAPDETADDFAYETPGSFVGPEVSPNFLGIESRSSFSFRPGLPDTGNNPTAVVARTDVENPDAGSLREFNREMVDREGETTARPKPASEVNPGEIEAVIPPGARFREVGDGGVSLPGVGRVGADFFTEVDGRRVPIRTVAPEDRVDAASGSTRGLTDFLSDERGQLGGRPDSALSARQLDEIAERVETPTDRPLPVRVGESAPQASGIERQLGVSDSASTPGRRSAPTEPSIDSFTGSDGIDRSDFAGGFSGGLLGSSGGSGSSFGGGSSFGDGGSAGDGGSFFDGSPPAESDPAPGASSPATDAGDPAPPSSPLGGSPIGRGDTPPTRSSARLRPGLPDGEREVEDQQGAVGEEFGTRFADPDDLLAGLDSQDRR